jgi:hypothetical protein
MSNEHLTTQEIIDYWADQDAREWLAYDWGVWRIMGYTEDFEACVIHKDLFPISHDKTHNKYCWEVRRYRNGDFQLETTCHNLESAVVHCNHNNRQAVLERKLECFFLTLIGNDQDDLQERASNAVDKFFETFEASFKNTVGV